jgi:hypothetical protein
MLRVVDSKGEIVVDQIPPERYQELIEEAVEPFSYMKFPYFKKLGYPQGIYRVGPLARLNLIDHCGTPIADQEWAEFREIQRGAVSVQFHYHHARFIEIIFGIEKMERILKDPQHPRHQSACPRPAQPQRGRRRRRSAARHPDSPLPHRRQRPGGLGQPHHRHRSQQPGHEPRHPSGRSAFHLRRTKFPKARSIASRRSSAATIRAFPARPTPSGQMPLRIELVNSTGEVIHEIQSKLNAPVLVIGYGNVLRGDDGAGPAAAALRDQLPA